MQINSLEDALITFAATGVLAAPYIIGLRAPEDYAKIAKIWVIAGIAIAALTWAYTLGFRKASPMTEGEIWTALETERFIVMIATIQSLALVMFDVLYMMEKRLKKPKHNPVDDTEREEP